MICISSARVRRFAAWLGGPTTTGDWLARNLRSTNNQQQQQQQSDPPAEYNWGSGKLIALLANDAQLNDEPLINHLPHFHTASLTSQRPEN